jgi:hypothetical protein
MMIPLSIMMALLNNMRTSQLKCTLRKRPRLVGPGTKEICRAMVNSRHKDSKSSRYINRHVEVNLDSFGSVSIGHSSLLTNIKSCKEYNVPTVTLKGIGGKSEPLTKAGILKHVLKNKRVVKWLCYVFI